jgi:cytochrome c oxidase subunit IV
MAHGHDGHGGEHIGRTDPSSPFYIKHPPYLLFLSTYLWLVGLLVVTVWLYTVDISKALGWVGWNIVVAMIVAVIKAALVVRNFMNVRGGTKLILLWAVIGFIWLSLMIGIFMDYRTRAWVDQSGWQPLSYQGEGAPRTSGH